MGRAANLSVLGIYEWDNTLFDLMTIPEALDKEVLVMNLLAELAEVEVLYPNPVVMKNLIGVWSHKNIDVWNRLYATTQYDYNPIENYNRFETGTQSGSGSSTHSGTETHSDTSVQGGKDTHTDTKTQSGKDTYKDSTDKGGSDTVTGDKTAGHWIAAFDSTASGDDDGLVKKTRDEENAETTTEYGATIDSEGEMNYGKKETENGSFNYGKTESRNGGTARDEKTVNENNGEHTLHAHGNIGVTTTQKLIREQRDIDKFNLYDIIIGEFKMRFCILVY